MTVPALTTTDIATFAYFRQTGCTYVQLADVLPVLHNYQQHAEYVDGTIKIFDTGSETASPNNYVLVNVRIRADGWIMAWFPRTLMTGTADSGSGVTVTDTLMQIQLNGETAPGSVQANELAGYIFKPTSGPLSGNEYCIKSNTLTTIMMHADYGDDVSTNMATLGAATYDIIQSRGNLVWWGHHSSTAGNPTSQTTRLGRALYEMWEVLKLNQQGGSGAVLDYSDVGYWDYEYTSATHLYIFGHSISNATEAPIDKYYHCTIPIGVTLYSGDMNYGLRSGDDGTVNGYIETISKYSRGGAGQYTEGFVALDQTPELSANYGRRKAIRHYTHGHAYSTSYGSQAIILLTSG